MRQRNPDCVSGIRTIGNGRGEVGLHSECGLRRRRGAKAPRSKGAGQNRQRPISHLVNTSQFTEKGEGVDYRLKTRLASSMAGCACIRTDHFKQLQLCKSGVDQDDTTTIFD
ncbi:hypothetical protein COCMIDRAFT_103794 [Bipolaris oryzae ATCC 44560]|uniref:Uncharacterized protein n=1 Tax=Bipolaris oryzae ATCC 44560 TaxID=930090 RepID=W6YSB0_COCMI|nr:uncharacterized protein COCMIDRAFT_103794 [Bipolaris oryzae ATCC 44560]EUC42322.1 hypothetical protein COCMIDRAFT_103794 [Bipolaris oryzae ATCC 44560]